jgi:hypothetical protein
MTTEDRVKEQEKRRIRALNNSNNNSGSSNDNSNNNNNINNSSSGSSGSSNEEDDSDQLATLTTRLFQEQPPLPSPQEEGAVSGTHLCTMLSKRPNTHRVFLFSFFLSLSLSPSFFLQFLFLSRSFRLFFASVMSYLRECRRCRMLTWAPSLGRLESM